ncbi:MAG: VUT family protein [Parvularculaceae bacterium]|nr:VUT family protein [Parvularculaceae bacterium]
MEAATAVETRRPIKETPLEKLARETRRFFAALARIALFAGLLIPILVFSFLTVDIPYRGLDHFFSTGPVKPGNWLSVGYFAMAAAPPIVILIARRFGGEEASRVVTAAWAVAAFAAFAGVSYLSPQLEDGDMPSTGFVIAFIGSAIASQFIAGAVYDITRGGERWWRAPFFALLCAYLAQTFIYFPIAYWGAALPWANWMVEDIALKSLLIVAFLGVYRLLMKGLRPRGGYGG